MVGGDPPASGLIRCPLLCFLHTPHLQSSEPRSSSDLGAVCTSCFFRSQKLKAAGASSRSQGTQCGPRALSAPTSGSELVGVGQSSLYISCTQATSMFLVQDPL